MKNMNPKLALIALSAAFVVLLAHDVKTYLQARKLAKLFLESYKEHKEADELTSAKFMYLIHLLIENDVDPSEFNWLGLTFDTIESN